MIGAKVSDRCLVWVPLTEYTESIVDVAFSEIDFSMSADFDKTLWTRSGDNPNWSIGVIVR